MHFANMMDLCHFNNAELAKKPTRNTSDELCSWVTMSKTIEVRVPEMRSRVTPSTTKQMPPCRCQKLSGMRPRRRCRPLHTTFCSGFLRRIKSRGADEAQAHCSRSLLRPRITSLQSCRTLQSPLRTLPLRCQKLWLVPSLTSRRSPSTTRRRGQTLL